MIIELQLTNACLETQSKRAYERLIKAYFDKAATDENRRMVETRMVPLHHFLNHANFSAIRRLNPELSGIEALFVELHFPNGHHTGMEIRTKDKVIHPIWKTASKMPSKDKED